MTWLLGQVALVFQVALTRAGDGTFMVTVQLLEPATATLTQNSQTKWRS